MIRVVMFDFGLTLVDAHEHPYPHVSEALAAIAEMRTADGRALRSALVCDHEVATPPATAQKLRAISEPFFAVLQATGLQPLFEPVRLRVTLSTNAGAALPARAVFDKALVRLQVKASLDECLFVTGHPGLADAVHQTLPVQVLRFGAKPAADFDDWLQAPALIAWRLDPAQIVNTQAAAKAHLAAQGIELQHLAPGAAPDHFALSGQRWCPVAVPGQPGPVHVAVPVTGVLMRGPKGALQAELPQEPAPDALAEAAGYARSLATHGQIESGPVAAGAAPRGATHTIETTPQGQRRLVRKRFSAL